MELKNFKNALFQPPALIAIRCSILISSLIGTPTAFGFNATTQVMLLSFFFVDRDLDSSSSLPAIAWK